MWSIANEPRSDEIASEKYFSEVRFLISRNQFIDGFKAFQRYINCTYFFPQIAKLVKSLDQTRPITAAISQSPNSDLASQFLDVIMFNYYASWYSDAGDLQVVQQQV